jgi:hypothetical protein
VSLKVASLVALWGAVTAAQTVATSAWHWVALWDDQWVVLLDE